MIWTWMAMLPVRDTVVVMTFVSDTGDLEMETPHQAGCLDTGTISPDT